MPRPYTIGRLAQAVGVNVETIRYYQRLQLLSEPPRPLGGVRRYSATHADRVRFIKRAQAMGFALAEIRSLLSLQTQRSCRATRELAAAKLGLVDARIRELRYLHKELAGLIADCDANAEDRVCPVIQRLTLEPRISSSPTGPT
jgi:MerR family transcriptional regulator, mercuric resistance operon regulatory protein